MEIKQSRMPSAMKDAVKSVISCILERKQPPVDELASTIEDIMAGNIPLEDLAMKGKLTQDLDKYKVLSGASAGAKWANDYLGKGYRAGDYFKTTLDSEGNYIAFDKASDLDG